jgi:hypothetical protein
MRSLPYEKPDEAKLGVCTQVVVPLSHLVVKILDAIRELHSDCFRLVNWMQEVDARAL